MSTQADQVQGAPASDDRPAGFNEIWDAELSLIAAQRHDGVEASKLKTSSCGLAFSGGGIRSATFNLGIIQALAEKHLLRRFDYLSTVSGGGYIGGWLSTLIQRRAGGDVAKAEDIISATESKPKDSNHVQFKEDKSIRWLRAYSNYLTPTLGLMSGDAQAALATWLRNFFLNMTLLVALLTSVLLLPRVLQKAGETLAAQGWFAAGYALAVLLLALPAVLVITLNLMREPADKDKKDAAPWYTRKLWLTLALVLPVLIAAWLGAEYLAKVATPDGGDNTYLWVLYTAGLYFLPWLVVVTGCYVWLYRKQPKWSLLLHEVGSRKKHYTWWAIKFIIYGALAGIIGGVLFKALAGMLAGYEEPTAGWIIFVFGAPLFLLAVLTMVVVHIGLMARNFDDQHHELWSRVGGMFQTAILLWLIFSGISAFGAALIDWLATWALGGGLAWLLASLGGVLLARSPATGEARSGGWRELVVKTAPYVFVIGFLVLIAWGMQAGLKGYGSAGKHDWFSTADCNQYVPPQQNFDAASGLLLMVPGEAGSTVTTKDAVTKKTVLENMTGHIKYNACIMNGVPQPALNSAFALMLLLTLLLGWRINVNLYSIHKFYRNRLMRCYLGATNEKRRPNPVTGLDPEDDVELKDLAQRPYHLFSATVNLNGGYQLAWQSRRAASFLFSPLYTGYEPASRTLRGGYRPTAQYAVDETLSSLKVGTAVACSGAAASPNWGFHTNPAVAFLLTVFNVRIGRWCGNTSHPKDWRSEDPSFSLRYWITEMTGRADANLPFVYVSDGGHFENLGIYELVRRRCKLIVVGDAGADPGYIFDDLGGAIRKCYIDLGVEIEINVNSIAPPEKGKPSELHYAIGTIHYDRAKDPSPSGLLIYIKASLTKDMPTDLRHYKSEHDDFPHETTADQFFDENQFESYRKLGHETVVRSIEDMIKKGKLPSALT